MIVGEMLQEKLPDTVALSLAEALLVVLGEELCDLVSELEDDLEKVPEGVLVFVIDEDSEAL